MLFTLALLSILQKHSLGSKFRWRARKDFLSAITHMFSSTCVFVTFRKSYIWWLPPSGICDGNTDGFWASKSNYKIWVCHRLMKEDHHVHLAWRKINRSISLPREKSISLIMAGIVLEVVRVHLQNALSHNTEKCKFGLLLWSHYQFLILYVPSNSYSSFAQTSFCQSSCIRLEF